MFWIETFCLYLEYVERDRCIDTVAILTHHGIHVLVLNSDQYMYIPHVYVYVVHDFEN